MIANLLEQLAAWIQSVISAMGYAGVAGLMGIESACIPLPSEVIMPFAGSLVPARFTLIGCALAGAIGCVVGSIPAYYAGALGGRDAIEVHEYRQNRTVVLREVHFRGDKRLRVEVFGFRHTWSNPYESVPERSMLFLVRDRAAPNHPSWASER